MNPHPNRSDELARRVRQIIDGGLEDAEGSALSALLLAGVVLLIAAMIFEVFVERQGQPIDAAGKREVARQTQAARIAVMRERTDLAVAQIRAAGAVAQRNNDLMEAVTALPFLDPDTQRPRPPDKSEVQALVAASE